MTKIDSQHYSEWRDSGVDPSIIRDNVRSCHLSLSPYDDGQDDPYEYLFSELPNSERRNDGRIRDGWLKKYRHIEHGGWWCSGIDLLSPNCQEISHWGCFKPNKPRRTPDGKLIKYEHPPKSPTGLFALQVRRGLWEEIAAKFNVEIGEYTSFWQWIVDHRTIPILITEGAKKAGILLTHKYVVIALPGIWNGIRRPNNEYGEKTAELYLIPELAILATPTREFIIVFDHDTKPKTLESVNAAIRTTGSLLLEAGCKVSVIGWNYPEKGVDDLIVAHGIEVFDRLYENRCSLAQWEENQDNVKREAFKVQARNQWNYLKKYSSSGSIDKKYFEWDCPPSGTITFIKSPLGTGKTTWLCKIMAQLAASHYGGISLGYRNTLLLQWCAKSGFYHIHEHNVLGLRLIWDEESSIASCVDSLLHFEPDNFIGKILIIDEVVSVIKHLLFSPTIPVNKLMQILERFAKAVQLADRVICLDGLMADWVVDYLKSLCPQKQILTIENTYLGDKAPIYYLQGTINPKTLKTKKNDKRLFYLQLLQSSHIPAVASDSQVFLEALDELFISQGRVGIRVDSKTVSEDHVKEFLADPTLYILKYKPEYLLYSPSAESGLDVPITDYFSEHFGFFFGCIDADSIIQMSGRIRDVKVAKYLWVSERAINTDLEGTRSPIVATLEWAKNQCLTQDIHSTLNGLPDSAQIISNLTNLIETCKDTHWKTALAIEAMWNHERGYLRECVYKLLTRCGHQVEIVVPVLSETLKYKLSSVGEQVSEQVEAVKTQNSRDIFNASDEYVGKSHLVKLSFENKWEQRTKIMKAKIIDKLPGVNESEQWSFEFIKYVTYEQPQLLGQLELFWLLHNPDIAVQLSELKYHQLLTKRCNGEAIAPWKLRQQYSIVKALRELGIVNLVSHPAFMYQVYHSSHPVIKAIAAKGKQKKYRQVLGRSPGKDPIKYVASLLRLIGVEFKAHQVRGEEGQRYRVYAIDRELLNNPYRQLILECINKRYSHRNFEPLNWEISPSAIPSDNTPQIESEQGLDPVTDPPHKCINNERESVTGSKEEIKLIASDFELLVKDNDFITFKQILKAYKTVLNRTQLNQAVRLLSSHAAQIIRGWVLRINQSQT
ncbi:conserved hypothetical protein (plasmid) [Gloeothece citriformis PCC 7424]|uniref:DUF3854 domain-containing protein n=1 Tax=Gloeothece citriformis (strain PCC 7424) TaxID=65393 RepID=B7KMM2_GLOC7|nr:plasmid replication protein, CyRepA1 family [Gloeothece citriformis]ACK74044.1 conserved hypothetical protein [Gloeothece citriformis PCC 7424]